VQPAGKWQRKKFSGRYFVGEFGAYHYTHIYAVQPLGGGNIKFGQALNVKSRFSGIQTGSPVRLRLLGSVYVPEPVEAEIHDYLKDHRSHGEWFFDNPLVLKVAGLISTGDAKGLIVELSLFRFIPEGDRVRINFSERMADKPLIDAPPSHAHGEELLSGFTRPK
jgi:hypothetical protein